MLSNRLCEVGRSLFCSLVWVIRKYCECSVEPFELSKWIEKVDGDVPLYHCSSLLQNGKSTCWKFHQQKLTYSFLDRKHCKLGKHARSKIKKCSQQNPIGYGQRTERGGCEWLQWISSIFQVIDSILPHFPSLFPADVVGSGAHASRRLAALDILTCKLVHRENLRRRFTTPPFAHHLACLIYMGLSTFRTCSGPSVAQESAVRYVLLKAMKGFLMLMENPESDPMRKYEIPIEFYQVEPLQRAAPQYVPPKKNRSWRSLRFVPSASVVCDHIDTSYRSSNLKRINIGLWQGVLIICAIKLRKEEWPTWSKRAFIGARFTRVVIFALFSAPGKCSGLKFK